MSTVKKEAFERVDRALDLAEKFINIYTFVNNPQSIVEANTNNEAKGYDEAANKSYGLKVRKNVGESDSGNRQGTIGGSAAPL